MTQKLKDLLGSVPQMAVWPTLEAKAASAFLTHLVDVWGSLLLHHPWAGHSARGRIQDPTGALMSLLTFFFFHTSYSNSTFLCNA